MQVYFINKFNNKVNYIYKRIIEIIWSKIAKLKTHGNNMSA